MANRTFGDVQALNKEVKIITGRFDSSDETKAGLGWSAADSGTGKYTITLDDTYNTLLSCTANAYGSDGYEYTVGVFSHDVASAKTVVLATAKNGTLSDLAASDEIHFVLMLQNSSVKNK